MAIDFLSASRAKAADTPNARGAPPMPSFDAGKMFSQMLEQSFANRDAARQTARSQTQAPTREERQPAPATRTEDAAPRPAAPRATAKERPAPGGRRDAPEEEDMAVDRRARPERSEEHQVEDEAGVAAGTTDEQPAPDQDKAENQPDAQPAVAVAVVAPPVPAPPKADTVPAPDDKAEADLLAQAARTAPAAPPAADTQALQDDKAGNAAAAALQAMTPQQVTQATAALPGAKAVKPGLDPLREQQTQAEAALADLLADIGGGSITSVPAASGTGAGGQPGGGLLDGAAWSLMQQSGGMTVGTNPQATTFAGLMQAGLAAVAEAGDDAATTAAVAASADAPSTTPATAVPALGAGLAGIDGADAPHVAAQAHAARHAPPIPVADQIATHIGKAIKDEVKAINVQLNPEELGRVDIRLEFGQDGRVSAHIVADNQQALDLLQRDQRALERSLADAGLKTDNSSLNFSLRQDGSGNEAFNRFAQNQDGGQQGQGRSGRGGRDRAVADVTAVDAGPAARPRTIAADGALDIKV